LPNPEALLQNNPTKKVLLLGNEAIVRGILESGIGVVTTYPGTPASEIGDTASEIASRSGLYMEYSTNEKVAVEVAAGSAVSGVRALTAMKHVGLNVAADALMTLAYVGVNAGYVIITADDPECYSSQNEQDNRYYSLLSNLPCLEPSNPQEAKDMITSATMISEKLQLPVLLRTTTRVSHTRGPVTFGRLQKPNVKGNFVRDRKRFVMVPAFARTQHVELLKKLELANEISERSEHNTLVQETKSGFGLISSGGAYNYAVEAADLLNLRASFLKLGMTHPLPQRKIAQFLRDHRKIIVVEELEPYLEMQVRTIAQIRKLGTEIYGKLTEKYFSRKGELSTMSVAIGISRITRKILPSDFEKTERMYAQIAKDLPPRPPILCAGCPHRASFYVMRKVGGEKTLCATDIGCYALGIAPPLSVGDLLICMGASIGTAQGMSRATGRNTIAALGDSTFFHAAIPGLVNAVYNNAQITLIVLDNSTTAMTGHQPHPGTGMTGMGSPAQKISIEDVAKGIGVKYVKVVNPFNLKEATSILNGALNQGSPSVIVFRAPCTLLTVRERRRRGVRVQPLSVSKKCRNCMACITLLGCPAMIVQKGKVEITDSCTVCGLCASICPYGAIKGVGRGE
jgi:indolepyruvate ferredoxin oxidoreductase alpha subunit